jgi:hypothetical protein
MVANLKGNADIERGWSDDVMQQACGGSVAAIIHILNHKLSDTGIRTRAVMADGILQLLCEATTAAQLDHRSTVDRIQAILEHIAPRGIRRVRLYGRIVQEQQLLWLEAIQRDPDLLLWSESIVLKRSHLLRWMAWDRQFRRRVRRLPSPFSTSATLNPMPEKQPQFWQGVVGGIGLTILVLLGLGFYFNWFELTLGSAPDASQGDTTATPIDPFVQAVRIAEMSAIAGQTANSADQWQDLADRWQEAATLMGQVAPDDPRYRTAQDRQRTYQQNSNLAAAQAQRYRNAE